MTDINAPIQIPCELNVPETTNRDERIEPIKPKSAAPAILPQSADGKLYPKHRLQKEAKSQSMFNFSARERSIHEPKQENEEENDSEDNKNNDENDADNEDENNDEAPPTITLSPPSAKYRKSADRKSTGSLDHLDRLRPSEIRHISASTNEMKFSINRNRANSVATVNHSEREDDEFDELGPNGHTGSQLRIRSSIVSLFGRMGKMRRTSSISQSSVHGNGVSGTENSGHTSTLRALPQIAATKILRAFSYVGKPTDDHKQAFCIFRTFFLLLYIFLAVFSKYYLVSIK